MVVEPLVVKLVQVEPVEVVIVKLEAVEVVLVELVGKEFVEVKPVVIEAVADLVELVVVRLVGTRI